MPLSLALPNSSAVGSGKSSTSKLWLLLMSKRSYLQAMGAPAVTVLQDEAMHSCEKQYATS
jgi:hypothetical protein